MQHGAIAIQHQHRRQVGLHDAREQAGQPDLRGAARAHLEYRHQVRHQRAQARAVGAVERHLLLAAMQDQIPDMVALARQHPAQAMEQAVRPQDLAVEIRLQEVLGRDQFRAVQDAPGQVGRLGQEPGVERAALVVDGLQRAIGRRLVENAAGAGIEIVVGQGGGARGEAAAQRRQHLLPLRVIVQGAVEHVQQPVFGLRGGRGGWFGVHRCPRRQGRGHGCLGASPGGGRDAN
ncbi:Uncharacterised protein [Bordetella pertussis]|nr:Uncharacterised protein [Bordetella pertussis]CFN62132.1 Uncharacterised protein [Bordetella pertussis]CFO29897.1 Uncharacterised protein [Bordetella pertussis]CFO38989.1 Uncharacterised protein [Bordetella pertussis]CFP04581.1 Uncharacterised protein [Bordetella pertussis]